MNKLHQLYLQYRFVRWLLWLGIVIPGVPFILVSAGFLLFMFWPRDYQEVTYLPIIADVEYLTLSAHGVKDTSASWSDELQSIFAGTQEFLSSNVKKQHVSLSWQPYSDNVLICSVVGKKIGNELGKKIANMSMLKGVHLIGHSCGSFIVLGICESLKEQNASISVQSTYLDPVSVYSGLSWDYGLNHFGRCADFSDAYIDTEDTVPGSNQNLPYVYTFDVTQVRTKNNLDYPPHKWPTIFYLNAMKKNQVPIYFKSTPELTSKYQKDILMQWPSNYN